MTWYFILFIIIACVALLLLVRGLWENVSPRLTNVSVKDERLPEAFSGLKIAHVSDFHNAKLRKKYLNLLDELAEAKPDIVVITGDLIDKRRRGLSNAATLIEKLTAIAPTYYVTGNHEAKSKDFPQLLETLLAANVTVLRNQKVPLSRGGDGITLTGLDDGRFFHEQEEERWLKLSTLKGEGYTVLLSHRPHETALFTQLGASVVFCGHAHGGQLRAFGRGLIAPDQGLFPKYTAGVHRLGDTRLIISRGLGNGLVPIRLNNRPELLLITMRNA